MVTKKRKRYKDIEVENWVEPQPKSDSFLIRNKFKFTEVHESFLNLCLYDKTKMVLVDGSAGTGKTYIAVLAGLTLLKERAVDQIIYIRSIVESATKSIGALPGELDEKFKPWSLPMLEKMHEIMTPTAASKLIEEGLVKCIPVNFVRGLTFHNSFVIIDESQNLTKEELVTILTRFGHNSKFIVVGDSKQKDIGNLSGFEKVLTSFVGTDCEEQGIQTITFGPEEIVRSQILRFIVKKLGC
jgi:phosphate starvation-inducible PhoH-like protein